MGAYQDLILQVEPTRKTFLDILQRNMETAEREALLQRVIFIGEHNFGDEHAASAIFQENIKKTNDSSREEERLSGLFLEYTKYFCHMLEGTEHGIMFHLRTLLTEYGSYIGRMKLLVEYNHISNRFYRFWHYYSAKPPTLLEKIDISSDMEKTFGYVMSCVRKLYSLAEVLKPDVEYEEVTAFDVYCDTSYYLDPSRSHQFSEASRPSTGLSDYSFRGRQWIRYLPEIALMDFLLSSIFVQDLRDYFNKFGNISDLESDEDVVWPVATDFVPFNVFDEPHDPAEDLSLLKQSDVRGETTTMD